MHVLMIEDSPSDAVLVQALLEGGEGPHFEVERREWLSEGLVRLAEGGIDAVLLDLTLPDSMGLDTFRQAHRRFSEVPILVMTGTDDMEAALEAVRQGASDYLVKGQIDRAALVRAIRYAHERKRVERALRSSEARYRSLFQHSPVALREEDFSGIKKFLDKLSGRGCADIPAYLVAHPEAVAQCAASLRVVDANAAALELYGVASREELQRICSVAVNARTIGAFRGEIEALAAGRTRFETETSLCTAQGELKHVLVRWSVPPGYEQSLSRVWVSVIDLTERRHAEEALRDQQRQLMAGQEILKHILPQGPPLVAGVDVAGGVYPAQYVAGDYFDYPPLGDGKLAVAVGDVTGHGFASALLVSSLHTVLRSLVSSTGDVAEILNLANDVLVEITEPDRFVSLFLGQLDPATGAFCYASAGHPTAYVLDEQGAVRHQLQSTGMPLGLFAEAQIESGDSVRLDPGDMLLVVTDGFSEAQSPAGELFGMGRTLDAVRANQHERAGVVIHELYQAVRDFTGRVLPKDDVTAVIMKMER